MYRLLRIQWRGWMFGSRTSLTVGQGAGGGHDCRAAPRAARDRQCGEADKRAGEVGGPGSEALDAEPEPALASGESGGDVDQLVAQRFGCGRWRRTITLVPAG